MPTKIYHAWPRDVRQAFSDRLADLDEDRLMLVAHLATDDLEQAFAWTQHDEAPWRLNTDRVLALQPGPYPLIGDRRSPVPRSTSVGDVIEIAPDGQRFLVASVGFVPLPPRPATTVRFPLHYDERHRIGPFSWDIARAWQLVGQRELGNDAPAAPELSSPHADRFSMYSAPGDLAGSAVMPHPDGSDALLVVAQEVLARLGELDLRQALTDAVDPHIPVLIAPSSTTTSTLASASMLIDGRRRLVKSVLEDWSGVPYYCLTMPETAVCCEAFTPFLTYRSHRHTCGYPLIETALAVAGDDWRWEADVATPLLRRCPHCRALLRVSSGPRQVN